MDRLNTLLEKLYTYFIPHSTLIDLHSEYNIEKYHKNMELLRKIRLMLTLNCIILANIVFFSMFWLFKHGINEPRLFVFPAIVFFLLASMYIMKSSGEHKTMFFVTSMIVCFIIPVQMFFSGGLKSVSIIWILIQPLLLTTVYDFRRSVLSSTWIFIYLIGFYFFDEAGYDLPLNAQSNSSLIFISLVFALFIFYLFIYFSGKEKERMIAKIKKLENDKIVSLLEEMQHYKNKANAFLKEYGKKQNPNIKKDEISV